MTEHVVWVVRHAKSGYPIGVGDFSRPLAPRGRRQGPRMAAWLRSREARADIVLTSAARRAVDTAEQVRQAFDLPPDALVERRALYLADAADMLDALRALPEDTGNAAIVGHNPGITRFVNRMAGTAVLGNLPTFGIAQFTLAAPWSDVEFEAGRLDAVVTPATVDDA